MMDKSEITSVTAEANRTQQTTPENPITEAKVYSFITGFHGSQVQEKNYSMRRPSRSTSRGRKPASRARLVNHASEEEEEEEKAVVVKLEEQDVVMEMDMENSSEAGSTDGDAEDDDYQPLSKTNLTAGVGTGVKATLPKAQQACVALSEKSKTLLRGACAHLSFHSLHFFPSTTI